MTSWDDPYGEQSEGEKGRNKLNTHGLLEKLPGSRNVVVPANVRDKKASEVGGRESDAGGIEASAELHRPYERITVPVLSRLSQLQNAVPGGAG